MKFYTNYDPKPAESEVFRAPSETIPGQSMTVAELVARYVRTGVVPVKMHPDNGGNSPIEDVDPLDLQPDDSRLMFDEAQKKLHKSAPNQDTRMTQNEDTRMTQNEDTSKAPVTET